VVVTDVQESHAPDWPNADSGAASAPAPRAINIFRRVFIQSLGCLNENRLRADPEGYGRFHINYKFELGGSINEASPVSCPFLHMQST
jgi:hypothetical protein